MDSDTPWSLETGLAKPCARRPTGQACESIHEYRLKNRRASRCNSGPLRSKVSCMTENTQKDYLTPKEAAKVLGHSRNYVMAIINAGELMARDESAPGAKLPRYRITRESLREWQAYRLVVKPSSSAARLKALPRLEGVVQKRIEARHKKRQRQAALAQNS